MQRYGNANGIWRERKLTHINTDIQWPGWETVRKIGSGSFGSVYEIERKIFDLTEKAALQCYISSGKQRGICSGGMDR